MNDEIQRGIVEAIKLRTKASIRDKKENEMLAAFRMQCKSLLINNKLEDYCELQEKLLRRDMDYLTDYAIKHNLIRSEEC